MSSKEPLKKLEIEVANELEKKRDHKRGGPLRPKNWKAGGNTRIADGVRKGERYKPPVPDKPLREIVAMDPDDPEFRHRNGRPRHERNQIPDPELDAFELIRKKRQDRARERRARVRKYEAVVIKAQETLETHVSSTDKEIEVFDEDRMIAEGVVSLDDWDDEELSRGYRRNRDGRFGKPPKYVPREIQQEAFRRLVSRGERRMKEAYMKVVEDLIELSHTAVSEKVRLDAQRELLNRVVGKTPDRLMVTHDEPWVDVLADSFVPISELPPIPMEVAEDGVAYADPIVIERGDEDAASLQDPGEATRRDPSPEAPSSPRRSKKTTREDTQ